MMNSGPLKTNTPSDRPRGRRGRMLAQFMVILLLVILFIALLGALIYALYRVALVDKRLYSHLFAFVLCAGLIFMVARGIRRGKMTLVLRRIARSLLGLVFVVSAGALVMAYAALCIRYPVAGAVAFLPLAGLVFAVFFRLRLFAGMKKILNKI